MGILIFLAIVAISIVLVFAFFFALAGTFGTISMNDREIVGGPRYTIIAISWIAVVVLVKLAIVAINAM